MRPGWHQCGGSCLIEPDWRRYRGSTQGFLVGIIEALYATWLAKVCCSVNPNIWSRLRQMKPGM